jgi:hypothetical protein
MATSHGGGPMSRPRFPRRTLTSPDAATVRLDRAQREAIRREVAGAAGRYGAFDGHIAAGTREEAMRELRRLRGMFAVLDAIGWAEQCDAPDEQPVTVSSGAAWWARSELAGATGGEDAVALGALREIGARDALPVP